MTIRELVLLLEKHNPETPVLCWTSDYDSGSYGYELDLKKVVEKWGKKKDRFPDDYGWATFDTQEYPGLEKVVVLECLE